MLKLFSNSMVRQALALWMLLACGNRAVRAEEPITFVLPAANFQPVAGDAYAQETPPPIPPQDEVPLTPPPVAPTPPSDSAPSALVIPEAVEPEGIIENESYVPAEAYEPLECANCNGGSGGCDSCGAYGERLPNGQIPDDWMWGCGGWPYANGPGTCDDWKVGPIWDVTVDGMVMTREGTDLPALEAAMLPVPTGDPVVSEQFDRGPGGRVYLTGLVPRGVGYQVFAGYEGVEEWNAALIFPEEPEFPPFDEPTTRRNLYYRSSFHSGELNIMRMCSPAWRPYCGVRYIKFDDEIWDQSVQEMTPLPVTLPATELDTLNAFDIENNLIGFQGGVKYDLWQLGRRFSLQGFLNSGVYYNKAKYSNLLQEAETVYTAAGTASSFNESLTIAEQSNIAYVGEASLTGVCRLNKCWACRFGYQLLFVDGVSLASDAYLDTGVDDRSMVFHGWHAGIECRR